MATAPAFDPLATPETAVPDYTSPAIRTLMEECIRDAIANVARPMRDRADWRNLLFYRGGADNQFIRWDGTRWVPTPTDGEDGIPEWVVRCTTNVLAKKIDGMAAILDQSEPAQEWRPATDDDADLATAELCNDAIPVFLEEIDYEAVKSEIHRHIHLTNGCGLLVYYDDDAQYGVEAVQVLQCTNPACMQYVEPADAVLPDGVTDGTQATCPHCGAPLEDAFFPDGHAQAGLPIGKDLPRGKMCAHVIPWFELSLPSTATAFDETRVPWVVTHSEIPKSEACRLWPDAAEQIRGTGRQPAGARGHQSHQYAAALKHLAAPDAARDGGWGAGAPEDSVLVYRLFHDPIHDETASPPRVYPDGVFAVMIGETVVEAGPLPVKDDRGRPMKPILLRQFAPMPGSPYGKIPCDDLVPIQVQRNMLETLILMILMHDAAPTTWVPADVTLEDEPTGVPGAIHRYRSAVPGNRPQTERGVNPPESLYRSVELCDEKMNELSGLNAVLAGERPEGNPTLGEIQVLRERGMASFKTPLDALVRFEVRLSRLLLHLGRQSAWAPRFRQVRGENGEWDVKQFTNADLSGRVDVSVSSASAWPKSPLMTQLKIEKAVEMGVLVPAQDPELQLKLLTELDLVSLKPSLDEDRKQIMRKLEVWKTTLDPSQIAPPNPAIDNLPMHQHFLRGWMKTEEAERAQVERPMVYQAMVTHLQQIQMLLTPPAPVSHPSGQSGPPDGSAVDAAVQAGVLKPATTPASPLEGLAGPGGLLRPAGTGEASAKAGAMGIDGALQSGVIRPAAPRVQ